MHSKDGENRDRAHITRAHLQPIGTKRSKEAGTAENEPTAQELPSNLTAQKKNEATTSGKAPKRKRAPRDRQKKRTNKQAQANQTRRNQKRARPPNQTPQQTKALKNRAVWTHTSHASHASRQAHAHEERNNEKAEQGRTAFTASV